jgi:hypothetical protein
MGGGLDNYLAQRLIAAPMPATTRKLRSKLGRKKLSRKSKQAKIARRQF